MIESLLSLVEIHPSIVSCCPLAMALLEWLPSQATRTPCARAERSLQSDSNYPFRSVFVVIILHDISIFLRNVNILAHELFIVGTDISHSGF